MVFGSSKSSPLFNRFSLLYTYSRSDSIDSRDDDDRNSNADLVTLYDSNNRCTYNFNDIQEKSTVKLSVRQPQTVLPIPLPCIEPVPTEDLDEVCVQDQNGRSLQYSPKPLYQWNRPNSFTDKKNQPLKSPVAFETFFSHSKAFDSIDENGKDSDETSLLHEENSRKTQKLFKPFACHGSRKDPCASCDEDNLYLMNEVHAVNQGCFERQIAFDLDSVHEESLTSDDHQITMEPQWVLQPDEIVLETPPPTRGLNLSNLVDIDSRLYCDEDFMETDDEAELFSLLLHRHKKNSNSLFTDSPVDQFNKTKYNLLTENGVGSNENLVRWSHTRKTFAYGRLRRRSRSTRRRTGCTYRHQRKSNGRGSPIEGRTFSPNLSTVTEKPSEEDASCLPTPRNREEYRYLVEKGNLEVASHRSEEDTAETSFSCKTSSS